MAKLTAFFEMQDRITSKIANLSKVTDRYANTIEQVGSYGDVAFHGVEGAAASASAKIAGELNEVELAGDMAFDSIVDAAQAAGKKAKLAIKGITTEVEKLSGTSDKLVEIMKVGSLAAGAAIATAGGVALNSAVDLNRATNNLQASTGATDAEMAAFKSTISDIYNIGLGESFDDIGKAMATVRQVSGATGDDLKSITTNALLMRDTFEMEVPESIRAVNTMTKQFGITAEQAYNLIAQGAQKGANKNDDLLDTINEYSVQFKSLGFSAEQFTNTLIDGAANGAWSIDKVGDAIKEFNIRAKDGSKSSAEGFAALGLDADDMTTRFAQGGAVAQAAFQQVMQSMESMQDPVAKNAAGVALFGTMFEDLEAQGILAFGHISNSASMANDALGKIGAVKFKDFGSAMSIIGRQVETGIVVPVGDRLLPSLERFSGWVSNNMPAIQSTAGGTLTWIGNAIEFLANNFDVVGPGIAAVILTLVAPAFIAWASTAIPAAIATAVAMAPIVGVALAVGAAVTLLAWLWNGGFSKIIAYTSAGVDTVLAFFANLIGQALQLGSNFANGIVEGFTSMIGGIVNIATNIWDQVTGIFSRRQSLNVGVSGSAVDGSHANGLDYVPYDGYVAELHKGEKILTAGEAEKYNNLSPQETQQVLSTSTTSNSNTSDNSTTIESLFGSITINNEADIAKIIKMIEEYLREQLNSSGDGVYDV